MKTVYRIELIPSDWKVQSCYVVRRKKRDGTETYGLTEYPDEALQMTEEEARFVGGKLKEAGFRFRYQKANKEEDSPKWLS